MTVEKCTLVFYFFFNNDEGMEWVNVSTKDDKGINEFHLNQLASVGQIAAGIAHEVKNPLTAVKGFLQLLKESPTDEYLDIAQSELNNALATLENLLHVSKPDAEDEPYQPIKLAVELEVLFTLFQDQIYRVEIQRNLLDTETPIYGKRNQLKKALFNLLKNAFEAIPQKGTIFVQHYATDEEIHISIKDTGVGIPPEKLKMLGTPFYTTKPEGTGMGLTQVFSVIYEHQGKIDVHSVPGEGTTFHIKLPKMTNTPTRGVINLNVEYAQGEDIRHFLLRNQDVFEKRLLAEAVNVNEKINEIQRVGNIDLLSNAHKLVLYIVDGREHEMISFARKEGVAWAKYSLTLAFKLEWVQTVRRVLWDFLYNYDRLHSVGAQSSREQFFELERRINHMMDQFLNHFFISYTECKDQLIQSQREMVNNLSVPIIPLTANVCILPLIGTIDEERAGIIEEKVINHIGEMRIEVLILDLSGISSMETSILNQLMGLLNGMTMMGCKAVVTGLRPEVVKQIIRSGISFEKSVITKGTLQQALVDFLHE